VKAFPTCCIAKAAWDGERKQGIAGHVAAVRMPLRGAVSLRHQAQALQHRYALGVSLCSAASDAHVLLCSTSQFMLPHSWLVHAVIVRVLTFRILTFRDQSRPLHLGSEADDVAICKRLTQQQRRRGQMP